MLYNYGQKRFWGLCTFVLGRGFNLHGRKLDPSHILNPHRSLLLMEKTRDLYTYSCVCVRHHLCDGEDPLSVHVFVCVRASSFVRCLN